MMYKLRRVFMTARGDFRPKGKKQIYFATTERLEVDGVYNLIGNEFYRVDAIC